MDKPACGINWHALKLAQLLNTAHFNGILLGYYYFSCTITGACCILAGAFLITSSYMHWVFFFFLDYLGFLQTTYLPPPFSFFFFFKSITVHAEGNGECDTFCIVRWWALSAAAIFRISVLIIIWHLQYLHESVQSCFSRRQLGSDQESATIKLSCSCHYTREFACNWSHSFYSAVHCIYIYVLFKETGAY